jgi:choline dehydrogenase-like flavoprotein
VPGDPKRPLGGIIEIGAGQGPLDETSIYHDSIGLEGADVKRFMRQSTFRDHLVSLLMQAEDAPQTANRIDLDPELKDIDGLPVPRITYDHHQWELDTRNFYGPKMVDILGAAGARYGFVAPPDTIPSSKHIMGTLRFGNDPKITVCDRTGKMHDLDNLYAADGALFPTSSGYNPILTIASVGGWVGASMISPQSPATALGS